VKSPLEQRGAETRGTHGRKNGIWTCHLHTTAVSHAISLFMKQFQNQNLRFHKKFMNIEGPH
jgi:hypothetical protein